MSVLADLFSKLVAFVYRWRFSDDAKQKKNRVLELNRLLSDRKTAPSGIRSLSTLSRKTGMSDETCRNLLIEIGAVGVTMAGGREGWKLNSE